MFLLGPRDPALDYIRAADLTVISSRNEGFSYAFAEALLEKTPVVSTNVPIPNEVLPQQYLCAVENVEAIAGTPGVDVVLVGTNALCMEMGIPGQVGDPQVVVAMERIVAACQANGVHAGLGGVYEPALMQRYIDMGMRFILAGSDLSFLMAAAKDGCSAISAMCASSAAN